MVDTTEINHLLNEHFRVSGKATITPEGVVDIIGSVTHRKLMDQLPVKFGKVSGDFDLNSCGLTSLVNAPSYVGASFRIDANHLTSLENCPHHVGAAFTCKMNDLKSLVGAPTYVGSDFLCSVNQLTTLLGAPDYVPGDFACNNNTLTTLAHAPKLVGMRFFCTDNPLESLADLPERVGQRVHITYTSHLPLLRLLNYTNGVYVYDVPDAVNAILDAHKGQGKKGALVCAAELIRAGYKENARW